MSRKVIASAAAIVFVVLLFAAVYSFLYNRNEVRFSTEEQDWIKGNKNEILFMGYYDSVGERIFAQKLCSILSSKTGLKIVPFYDTWENNMVLLKTGKLPMSSAMNVTADRMKYLNFTQSFTGISSGLYSNIHTPIYNYKDISGKNIGVIKRVRLLDNFMEKYPGISFQTVFYDDIDSMAAGLRKGEINGFLSTKNFDDNMSQFYYFNIPTISLENNYIGVHKDYPELYSIISKGVDHLIKIGWGDAVQKAISFELERQKLRFNEAETAYMAARSTVTVGLINGYSFYGYEKDYTKQGIIPNIFDKISFLTDIQFEYVFDSYDKLMENDNIDLIPVASSGDLDSIYSNYVFSHSLSVVGKRGAAFIREIYDLEPYRVGLLEQDPEIDILIKQMPGIDLYQSNRVMDLLDLAEKGELDYILLPRIIADLYILQFDQLTNRGMLDKKLNYLMTKNENNDTLIEIINKCLAVIDMNSILMEEAARFSESKPDKISPDIALVGIVFLLGISSIIPWFIKKRKAELKLMYFDSATGVGNRIWLERKIGKDIQNYTFYLLNLKEFHKLKERYGQAVYDKAMEATVSAVGERVDREDLFALVDKEQFLLRKRSIAQNESEAFADDLRLVFGEKILIHDMICRLSAYVGFMSELADVKDLDGILECLDIAIYFSEREERAVRYSYEVYSRYRDKINFDTEFIGMVMNEKLEMFYRHVYDMSGDVFALDTYSTLCMEEFGYLGGRNFNAAVKRLGLVSQVDRTAIKLIIKHLADWEKQGKAVRVHVDLSEETIANEGFLSWVTELTQVLQQSVLVLKIDSSIQERNLELLTQVRSQTVQFLMKNFGGNLPGIIESEELPYDIVCIDSNYLLNLGENELYEEMLEHVIYLGKALGKKIMVADVDSRSQYDLMKSKRIDYISGKYLHTHMNIEVVSFESINSRRQ